MAKYKGWCLKICSGIQGEVEADNTATSIDVGSGSMPSKARIQEIDTSYDSKQEQTPHQDAYQQHLHAMYIEIIHKRFRQ